MPNTREASSGRGTRAGSGAPAAARGDADVASAIASNSDPRRAQTRIVEPSSDVVRAHQNLAAALHRVVDEIDSVDQARLVASK